MLFVAPGQTLTFDRKPISALIALVVIGCESRDVVFVLAGA